MPPTPVSPPAVAAVSEPAAPVVAMPEPAAPVAASLSPVDTAAALRAAAEATVPATFAPTGMAGWAVEAAAQLAPTPVERPRARQRRRRLDRGPPARGSLPGVDLDDPGRGLRARRPGPGPGAGDRRAR